MKVCGFQIASLIIVASTSPSQIRRVLRFENSENSDIITSPTLRIFKILLFYVDRASVSFDEDSIIL